MLAINLAYLNLKRWRYKEEVKEVAEKALDSLQSRDDNGSAVRGLKQFKALRFLADADHDRHKLPFQVHIFHNVFGREVDVKLSVAVCIIAALILIGGVAHGLSFGRWTLAFASRAWGIAYFWALVMGLVGPVAFVLMGRWLVKFAHEHSEECQTELASVYANQIPSAADSINRVP